MRGIPVDFECPHCRNKRTVRLAASLGSFCFNCRSLCDSGPAASHGSQTFGAQELRRLKACRGAVQAGVYSEFPTATFQPNRVILR